MNGYEQNLELLKQREQKNQHFSFVLLIDYILPIYRHIKALIDLTPELVLSDLKDYFEIKYKKREHPMDIDTLIYEKCQNLIKKKLTELEESQQILSNPKLDKLVELLKKHAEKANSRSKLIFVLISKVKFKIILVLILVERTFYAKKICEYLQNHSELKVCEMLSFVFLLIQLFLIVNRTLLNHVGLLVKMLLTLKNQTKKKIQH
jgi:ERCC4-related helicase